MKLSAQVRSSGYSIPGYEIEPQPQTVDGLNNNLKEESIFILIIPQIKL
jgi:hypothetical protein